MRKAAANSTYPKVAVKWLNQALCFYQVQCWQTVLCGEVTLAIASLLGDSETRHCAKR